LQIQDQRSYLLQAEDYLVIDEMDSNNNQSKQENQHGKLEELQFVSKLTFRLKKL